MLKSISKIFRGGFKAEATGVILLIIFYYLLLSRTGETLSTYEFVTSLLWMNFITAISLWLQSIRFYKNALRRNDKEDFKLSAAASMCLAVMFMAGSITMQSIPPPVRAISNNCAGIFLWISHWFVFCCNFI
ncbi:hypothetical protein AH582_001251 [Salmonella enterica subsp. enterica serovar Cubana]|nr:hypothetical protein [Salmonella enterica subsp. enterica serovar Cubana]